jgi:hypothetical protein
MYVFPSFPASRGVGGPIALKAPPQICACVSPMLDELIFNILTYLICLVSMVMQLWDTVRIDQEASKKKNTQLGRKEVLFCLLVTRKEEKGRFLTSITSPRFLPAQHDEVI